MSFPTSFSAEEVEGSFLQIFGWVVDIDGDTVDSYDRVHCFIEPVNHCFAILNGVPIRRGRRSQPSAILLHDYACHDVPAKGCGCLTQQTIAGTIVMVTYLN